MAPTFSYDGCSPEAHASGGALCRGMPIHPNPAPAPNPSPVLALHPLNPKLTAAALEARLHFLQAGQHGWRAALQVRDGYQAIGIAGQGAHIGVIQAPPLGPVLYEEDQLAQAGVQLCMGWGGGMGCMLSVGRCL